LLSFGADQSITGPMSPVLFAKEVAEKTGHKFNRLARIWFRNEKILQNHEADGLTGHDLLIIAHQYDDDLWISLWIDNGISGTPVAMAFNSDREIVLTPIYQRKEYVKKLDQQQLKNVFDYLFDHPEELHIVPFERSSQRA